MPESNAARQWLRENGYDDIADMIEKVMKGWRRKKHKTRRDWWDTLAGGKDGRPSLVNGVEFPVLKAAQIRQGKRVTDNALCRNPQETPPPKKKTGRWNPDLRSRE